MTLTSMSRLGEGGREGGRRERERREGERGRERGEREGGERGREGVWNYILFPIVFFSHVMGISSVCVSSPQAPLTMSSSVRELAMMEVSTYSLFILMSSEVRKLGSGSSLSKSRKRRTLLGMGLRMCLVNSGRYTWVLGDRRRDGSAQTLLTQY